jgi:dTDP-4-dehydrorhamnose 3,5-epimerase
MKLEPLALEGAFLIHNFSHADERGGFSRVFCQEFLDSHQLCSQWVQSNLSSNPSKGTLRGMHYQASPHEEVKLVQCVQGEIYDVIVDLRPKSATYLQWLGIWLSETKSQTLYVPAGFAHGFITLEDKSSVLYHMSSFYTASASRGLRWDDPKIGIQWPEQPLLISEQDKSWTLR